MDVTFTSPTQVAFATFKFLVVDISTLQIFRQICFVFFCLNNERITLFRIFFSYF